MRFKNPAGVYNINSDYVEIVVLLQAEVASNGDGPSR